MGGKTVRRALGYGFSLAVNKYLARTLRQSSALSTETRGRALGYVLELEVNKYLARIAPIERTMDGDLSVPVGPPPACRGGSK